MMIWYMDRAFCLDAHSCANKEKCSRSLTEKDEAKAEEIGLPIAKISFKDACGFFEEEDKK